MLAETGEKLQQENELLAVANVQLENESARQAADKERLHLLEVLKQQHQQLRALAGRLAEIQETERKQLAVELHDRVGQNLIVLSLNLNTIGTYVARHISADDSIRTYVNNSLALIEQTADAIREIMAYLRPPVLDDYGLLAALRWYGNQVAARTHFAVSVHGEEPAPRLPVPVEDTLFRIVQEALNNATKHAEANHITMALKTNDSTAWLTIADDGIGFEAALPVGSGTRQGWGLIIMSERAEAVGGHCRVESIPGSGTQIIVEVPR